VSIVYFTIIGTLVMLALGGGIIWFVILYQRKVIQSQQEIRLIQEQQQSELLQASIQSEESERMRIAAELHDDIAPTLASVRLYLSSAANQSRPGELLVQSKHLLDESLQKLRDIAHTLQPSTLYYLGLQTSLQSQADILNRSGSISALYKQGAELPRFNEQSELSLYRITQELINNILKHSSAKKLQLSSTMESGQVSIQLEHDGTGLTQEMFDQLIYKKGAIGLKNIVNRLKTAKANIRFEQAGVNLFRVEIRAPLS
jgi:two-component system, NarL family, sensor kinase